MPRSYVVTGGGRGVGRAVAERLLSDGGAVVIIEFDPEATAWARDHAGASRIGTVTAQRPVRGALPYATAKAATEGLTRALAVDYGRHGIRVNAVALGSISTERYQELLARQDLSEAARTEADIARLHPAGRIGQPVRWPRRWPSCWPGG